MSLNFLIAVVAVLCAAAVLFWPRREDGRARAPHALLLAALLAFLVLAFPTSELERQQTAAREVAVVHLNNTVSTLTVEVNQQKAADAELKTRLSEEMARVAKLESELAELRAKSNAEDKRRAKEASELEARLRAALEEFAAIEKRAGIETVTWSEAALFEPGKAVLDCSSRERLSRLVPYLLLRFARNLELSASVEGHTDNRGSVEYNKKLSEDRAAAVATYLVQSGITLEKVRTVGMWFQRPAGSTSIESPAVIEQKNATADLRQKNRRVEVRQVLRSSPQ